MNQGVIAIGSLIDWKMRSSRNLCPDGLAANLSLIDWKMRSSRNLVDYVLKIHHSLIDWKMRSSRNYDFTDGNYTTEFNRLENAL